MGSEEESEIEKNRGSIDALIKSIDKAIFVRKVVLVILGLFTIGVCIFYYYAGVPPFGYLLVLCAFSHNIYTTLIKLSELRLMKVEANVYKPNRR